MRNTITGIAVSVGCPFLLGDGITGDSLFNAPTAMALQMTKPNRLPLPHPLHTARL